MKNRILIIALILFSLRIMSQSVDDVKIPLIGDSSPKFTAETTLGKINFPDDYYGKWKILFSHPADFTPVCSSEILELSYMQDDFKKLNTQILVLSTDGINSHMEWIKSLESFQYKERESVKVEFPLISDIGLDISRQFGMIHSNSSKTKNIRGVFIIDPENKIRAIFFYPMTVGRNLEEIKRTLIALQESDKKDVLIPANWKEGDDVLIHSPKSVEESNKMKEKNDSKLYSYAWYMWFKKK